MTKIAFIGAGNRRFTRNLVLDLLTFPRLEGADVVLTTILAGNTEAWRHDIEIPKQYGVDLNVGNTRGPSGIFRFLRS